MAHLPLPRFSSKSSPAEKIPSREIPFREYQLLLDLVDSLEGVVSGKGSLQEFQDLIQIYVIQTRERFDD